jgi:hypothetical protein
MAVQRLRQSGLKRFSVNMTNGRSQGIRGVGAHSAPQA